jgi:predicted nucleic acid-binding protein
VTPDGALPEDAWVIESRDRLSWWDALIVAAARRQGCSHLLSEDSSDAAEFDGLMVIDLHSPDEVLVDGSGG